MVFDSDRQAGEREPRVSVRHRVGATLFFVYPVLFFVAGIGSLVEGSIPGFLVCVVIGSVLLSIVVAHWRMLHRHGSDDWRFSWTATLKRAFDEAQVGRRRDGT